MNRYSRRQGDWRPCFFPIDMVVLGGPTKYAESWRHCVNCIYHPKQRYNRVGVCQEKSELGSRSFGYWMLTTTSGVLSSITNYGLCSKYCKETTSCQNQDQSSSRKKREIFLPSRPATEIRPQSTFAYPVISGSRL